MIAAAACAAVFAGCSGGGGGAVVPAATAPTVQQPPTTVSGSAKVALTLRLPARNRAAAGARKRPRYVTGAIDGLAVRAAASGGAISAAPWQLFDLSPASSLCAAQPDGSRICTLNVYAPVASSGQDEFQVASYDATAAAGATTPAGNAISAADVVKPISVGTANVLSIQLSPVVASVATDKATYYTWAAPGQSANVALSLTPADADGALITADTPTAAPFAAPIAFSDTLAPSPFTYTALTTPGATAALASTVKYTAPAAGTAPPASATVALHGGAPAWVLGATANAGSLSIVPLILAGNAAGITVAPNGPSVPVTIAESGATGAYTVAATPSSVAGETVSLVDAGGNAIASLTPDGSGNATAYVKVTTTGPANGAASTLTVTDAHGVVGTVPIAIPATTSLTIGLPPQTGASVYYNVTGYPNTGTAIALAGTPANPYILAGNANANVALALSGSPGSVTATNAGAVGSYANMLTSDGTNVYFAQNSSNNAYRRPLNTVFVLATNTPLTYAGCDAIAAAQGYFWCEGTGLYYSQGDQLSQFGVTWAPQGNNPNYLGYYSNSASTPVLNVMTTGPNGVFFGSTPTALYSITGIASRTASTYTSLSFPQVGSYNGLATNANGDLFVADSTNTKVWKISAPVGVTSTVSALTGPSGGWRNPGGLAYDASAKILWVAEGDATGSSLGRVVKVTGY